MGQTEDESIGMIFMEQDWAVCLMIILFLLILFLDHTYEYEIVGERVLTNNYSKLL